MLASLYLMYAASSTWDDCVLSLVHCFVSVQLKKGFRSVLSLDKRCIEFEWQGPQKNTTLTYERVFLWYQVRLIVMLFNKTEKLFNL